MEEILKQIVEKISSYNIFALVNKNWTQILNITSV